MLGKKENTKIEAHTYLGLGPTIHEDDFQPYLEMLENWIQE